MKNTHLSLETDIESPRKDGAHGQPEFSWMAFSLRLLELKTTGGKSGEAAKNICDGASMECDDNGHGN